MITVRKATMSDSKEFAELVLISAPFFIVLFGDKIKTILQDLFQDQFNLFSFEHVYFADVNEEKAGMILSYDWQTKKRVNSRTGVLLFKKIGIGMLAKFLSMMRFSSTIGIIGNSEYYISNIATYPEFRGIGVGKRLILQAEQKGKMIGAKRIVLDVEKENIRAIDFYKKLGYKMAKEFSIPLRKYKILNFYRMTKEIK